jgi:hypothetical protein
MILKITQFSVFLHFSHQNKKLKTQNTMHQKSVKLQKNTFKFLRKN